MHAAEHRATSPAKARARATQDIDLVCVFEQTQGTWHITTTVGHPSHSAMLLPATRAMFCLRGTTKHQHKMAAHMNSQPQRQAQAHVSNTMPQMLFKDPSTLRPRAFRHNTTTRGEPHGGQGPWWQEGDLPSFEAPGTHPKRVILTPRVYTEPRMVTISIVAEPTSVCVDLICTGAVTTRAAVTSSCTAAEERGLLYTIVSPCVVFLALSLANWATSRAWIHLCVPGEPPTATRFDITV